MPKEYLHRNNSKLKHAAQEKAYFQASRKTRPASGEVMTIQSNAVSAAMDKQ